MKNCGSKSCKNNSNPQPFTNFCKDRKRKDKLTIYCKSCLKFYREINKTQINKTIFEWRKKNPEKLKSYRIKSSQQNVERVRKWRLKNPDSLLLQRYGMTKIQYNKIFNSQNGCCCICNIHQSNLKKSLHVDHDHKTNQIRGLLCSVCNQALGMFKDDIIFLNKAINYLKRPKINLGEF